VDIHEDYEEDFQETKCLHHTMQCHMRKLLVRSETPADYEAIDRVHNLAFGHDWESGMIRRIRSDASFRSELSLVVTEQDAVIGHVMFSHVTIESPVGSVPAAILAPLAVLEEHRRSGAGTALVTEGIRRCREKGYRIILVYGGPYYERFGFELAHEKGIFRPNPMLGEVVRVLALDPEALDGVKGVIKYPVAFRPLIEEWY